MSTQRTQAEKGWVSRAERDLEGRPICRRCGGVVPKPRRTFCSPECVHEWRLRTDPGYVRHMVYERDKGVCAVCHTDVFEATGRKSRWRRHGDLWQADHIVPVIEGGGECGIDNYRTLCTACHRRETAALAARRARPK